MSIPPLLKSRDTLEPQSFPFACSQQLALPRAEVGCLLWSAERLCATPRANSRDRGQCRRGQAGRTRGRGLLLVQGLGVAVGDEAGRGRLALSSHGPLGSFQQQAPLQWLLAGPGCVIVLVGFPSNEREHLARLVFIPKPFFSCTDP